MNVEDLNFYDLKVKDQAYPISCKVRSLIHYSGNFLPCIDNFNFMVASTNLLLKFKLNLHELFKKKTFLVFDF